MFFNEVIKLFLPPLSFILKSLDSLKLCVLDLQTRRFRHDRLRKSRHWFIASC